MALNGLPTVDEGKTREDKPLTKDQETAMSVALAKAKERKRVEFLTK